MATQTKKDGGWIMWIGFKKQGAGGGVNRLENVSGVATGAPAARGRPCLSGRNLMTERWAWLWWESASFHVQPEGEPAPGVQLIYLCYKENSRLGQQQAGNSKHTLTHTHTHGPDS